MSSIPTWWWRLYKNYSEGKDDEYGKSAQNQSQKLTVTTHTRGIKKRKKSNIYNAGLKYYLNWLTLILEF